MIIDLERFLKQERPRWAELQAMLDRLEAREGNALDLTAARRLHYLYERAGSDLGKLRTAGGEPELCRYLETIIARAYTLIHGRARRRWRLRPLRWLGRTFPRAVRRRWRAAALSVAVTLAGVLLGIIALRVDASAKEELLPFGHGQVDPAKRVEAAERTGGAEIRGHQTKFSVHLMTHNITVCLQAAALGLTCGVGTVIMLFYNGVILGGVCLDYVDAGQAKFLAAWLLPHGSVEIPAILLAGQIGLAIGGAMIGWGERTALRERMREVSGDLVTLLIGLSLLLVWAGIVEAFFSQYHEPLVPYWTKIAFGAVQLTGLVLWLAIAGRRDEDESAQEDAE